MTTLPHPPLIGRSTLLDDLLGNLLGTPSPTHAPPTHTRPTHAPLTHTPLTDAPPTRPTPRILRGVLGVGKTRLLTEVCTVAANEGIPTLTLVASTAMASVPLGVFHTVLPATALSGGALRRVMDSPAPLVVTASLIRMEILHQGIRLLTVDDAHLLDAASAGLLSQLSRDGVVVYLAVRSGERLHDAIEGLGTDVLGVDSAGRPDSSVWVDLRPLSPPHTVELLAWVLGGAVDRRLGAAVYDRTAGNARHTIEVARAAVRSGAIISRNGMWVLVRSLPLAAGMRGALRARIRSLASSVRSAAELVALAEPLDVEVLTRILSAAEVDEAESAGVVTLDTTTGAVRLVHPLQADAVLGSLTEGRRRERSRQLAGALAAKLETTGTPPDDDRLLLARLRLAIDDAVDADELLHVAELAHSSHPALCDQFLRAALREDGSVHTRVRIATLLAHQQRLHGAERVLDSIDTDQLAASERIRVASVRASLCALPANRPAEGLQVVDDAIATFGPAPALLAARSTALYRMGRVAAALVASAAVARDPQAPADAVVEAELAAGAAHFHAANADGFDAERRATEPLFTAVAHSVPEAEEAVALADDNVTLLVRDDLAAARSRGQRGYTDALHRGDDGVRAQHALQLGWNAVLAGDIAEGVSYLTEVLAARGIWHASTLPLARARMVETLVLSGDTDAARELLHTLRRSDYAPIYDGDVALADAAVRAADGDLPGAAVVATRAASRAYTLGQYLPAATGWYAATRYGGLESAARLIERSPAGSRGQEARHAHASALLRSDGVAAERASLKLEARGLVWFAVDAQAQAVTLHRAAGATYRATSAALRLANLSAARPTLRSPVVTALPGAAELTPRELEAASLAASGMRDLEISQELGISVRTVQTHLARVYNKLGARSRSELLAWVPPRSVSEGGYHAPEGGHRAPER